MTGVWPARLPDMIDGDWSFEAMRQCPQAGTAYLELEKGGSDPEDNFHVRGSDSA